MASMPGIVIKIGVDAAKAISNLDKVEKSLKRSLTPAQKFTNVLGKMGPALGVAAATAGAFAVAVGVDAVKAVMEEQKELDQLANTLDNLGFQDATAGVNKFIDSMQYSANVADTDLRPAFARLLRSTGDITLAQEGLQTALDISATTGKDLDTVANGLGKAYDGNKASLGRLGLGLDSVWLKTASMEEIMSELTRTMGGASDTRAGTLSGSIEGVNIALDELSESFGQGLVGNVDGTTKSLEEAELALRRLQPEAQRLGADINDVGTAALEAYDGWQEWAKAIQEGRFGDAWDLSQADGAEMDAVIERIRLSAAALDMQNAAASGAATALNRYRRAVTTTAAATSVYDGGGADWASIDARLKGARLRYDWQQMDAANARRAAKRAAKRQAAADARAAKIADRKHAARTGTKASNPKPGKRSC